ncbi:MAG: hypothetical protein LUD29_05900 [Clostridia bacterium]|nr:hypothetical protein [Clostridia bacterium]
MDSNLCGEIIETSSAARDEFFGGDILSRVAAAESLDAGERRALRGEVRRLAADARRELGGRIKGQLSALKDGFDEEKKRLFSDLGVRLSALNGEYALMPPERRASQEVQRELKDRLNGEKTITQRAVIKLSREYEREVSRVKSQDGLLLTAEGELCKEAAGTKHAPLCGMAAGFSNFRAGFSFGRVARDKKTWLTLLPFLMLIVIIVAYSAACAATGYKFNLDTIITYGIYVAVVAVGGVFIYSHGAFDMSLGPAAMMCAAIGGLAFISTGSIFMAAFSAVLLGVGLGLVNAFLANCLKLPVMVMTLTMMNILSSLFATIAENQAGGYVDVSNSPLVSADIKDFNSYALKWIILIVFAAVCFVLFNYTKIGRRNKLIGSNATAAKYTGISLMKAGLISFAISGIGLGLCGFLFITQNGYIETGSSLSTVGLNVIIAISIGGMPTSGGPRSRISAAIVGAFFLIFLEEFFAAMHLDIYQYLAKGVIFLAVAFVNFFGSRPKRLAQ